MLLQFNTCQINSCLGSPSRSHETGESVSKYAGDMRRLAKRAISTWNLNDGKELFHHKASTPSVQNAESATFEGAVTKAV